MLNGPRGKHTGSDRGCRPAYAIELFDAMSLVDHGHFALLVVIEPLRRLSHVQRVAL